MSMLPSSFTVGILVGQLSILSLLYLFVRYLLLSPPDGPTAHSPAPKPRPRRLDLPAQPLAGEDVEWVNDIIQQIVDAYRASLSSTPSPKTLAPMSVAETVRSRVETWINLHRSTEYMDEIVVHDTDLGADAPIVQHVRLTPHTKGGLRAEFDFVYTPHTPPSISMSTALIFNLPVPRFGTLPVSVNVALAHLSGTLIFHIPSSTNPVTMHLSSDPPLQLALSLSSLVGSKTKLADLPKLHDLVESRVRGVIEERLGRQGEGWEFVLPGLGVGIGGVEALARTLGEEVLGGEVEIDKESGAVDS